MLCVFLCCYKVVLIWQLFHCCNLSFLDTINKILVFRGAGVSCQCVYVKTHSRHWPRGENFVFIRLILSSVFHSLFLSSISCPCCPLTLTYHPSTLLTALCNSLSNHSDHTDHKMPSFPWADSPSTHLTPFLLTGWISGASLEPADQSSKWLDFDVPNMCLGLIPAHPCHSLRRWFNEPICCHWDVGVIIGCCLCSKLLSSSLSHTEVCPLLVIATNSYELLTIYSP